MKKLTLLAASVAALVAASPASAAVVFLDSVVQEAGNFRYNYRVEFAQDEGVQDGSNFAIFDFRGYVANSISATNAAVTANTELVSLGLVTVPTFTDDASITNLRFTYNGPRVDLSNQAFTGFSALSTFGSVALDGFSGVSVKTAGLTAGQPVFTQGPVGVPSGVPEPAAWAMMIGGFGLVGSSLRYRRRSTRVAFG